MKRAILLMAALTPLVHAQFQLSLVDGNTEHALVGLYDLGSFASNETGAARLRLRNTSAANASLTLLAVAGTGFRLLSPPALPVTVAANAAVDCTVLFNAPGVGSYSAVFRADGVTLLLTAAVVPSLSYWTQTYVGRQVLGALPLDFGSVEVGKSTAIHVSIDNHLTTPMPIPAITLASPDFTLSGVPEAGTGLDPNQQAGFDITFRPQGPGTITASLAIGSKSYPLIGTATGPPLPKPSVSVNLPNAASGQQGSVIVRLDAPAKVAGSGTLTLSFQPARAGVSDSTVRFASGGQTMPFTVNPGDTQVRFGTQTSAQFQTGTTAGTLTFQAQLGVETDQQSVPIAASPVGLTKVLGLRSVGSIEVEITGFDNTRTAGPLSFTFYDAAGNAVSGGAVRTDSTSLFNSYFQGSDVGGTFVLHAIFPVTGDVTSIVFFDAGIANSAGTSTSARQAF